MHARNPQIDPVESFRKRFRQVIKAQFSGPQSIDTLNSRSLADLFSPFREEAKRLGLDLNAEQRRAMDTEG
jgi:hypothetical protein